MCVTQIGTGQIGPLMEDDFDMVIALSCFLLLDMLLMMLKPSLWLPLEEYQNVLDGDNLHRYFISTDSWIENSRNEDSADDENIDMHEQK